MGAEIQIIFYPEELTQLRILVWRSLRKYFGVWCRGLIKTSWWLAMGICGNVLVVFVLFSTITLPRTHSLNDTVEICQSYCNIEVGVTDFMPNKEWNTPWYSGCSGLCLHNMTYLGFPGLDPKRKSFDWMALTHLFKHTLCNFGLSQSVLK